MSDFQKIEREIEYLTTLIGVQSVHDKPTMMLIESVESMRLLLDVTRAADLYRKNIRPEVVKYQTDCDESLNKAFTALREHCSET